MSGYPLKMMKQNVRNKERNPHGHEHLAEQLPAQLSQQKTLQSHADQADRHAGADNGEKKIPGILADHVSRISSQQIKAAVGDIDDFHGPEDKRHPSSQQEEKPCVREGIERLINEEFHR